MADALAPEPELYSPQLHQNTPNSPSKPNSRKRKSTDDGKAHPTVPPHVQKLLKRIVLSLSKPSYLLGVGSTRPRAEHRARLTKLMRKLVKQRNWVEASGVLSVLLEGSQKERSPANNRFKYWVLMEMLEHLDSNAYKVMEAYAVWEGRNAMAGYSPEYRYALQLERITLLITEGNYDEHAHHSTVMESNELLPHSEGHYAGNTHEAGTDIQCGSETSVMNDKVSYIGADGGIHRDISMGVDDMEIENSQPNFGAQSFYADPDEDTENENDGEMQYAPIFDALEGLESLLLPIRLPESTDREDFMNSQTTIFTDSFRNAVKYLRRALHSTPPVLQALLPLVQLLLIGGQVKEALNEIDNCCSPNTALPLRLRATLLEQFDRYNSALLSTCFEDVLKNDPTCYDSLAKLVQLHQNDEYSPESLLEMIALHLDATYADYNTWREFALCFLKLSQYDEDRMSVCLNGNEGEHKERYSVCFNRTPKMFIEGKSGESWRFRCRWWRTRHFSHQMLTSEIATGELQLLTYKAACAVHMYGSEFSYFVDAYACLEKENEWDLLMFLQTNIQNSVRIQSNFEQRSR
ncbi:uncharacterized protein LOC126584978 isoform X2 [Malus sylvestris]|uniref:uncharacterized protein LOC126584978 isoform X2 n=1 Tax=Malus sylvestris TaxID=3752 RepID=UPI0021AC80C7|nr:uncharacterized protein LOC126584978 isoform X2 [Malus sylvestris]